jgi:hypothetical protein
MNTRKYIFKVIMLVLSFVTLYQPSFAANEPVDPGQKTFRPERFTADFEKIDPYTGSLTLTHNDLTLPGNGGLDLNIYRIYETGRTDYYDTIAPGWASHFGRIKIDGFGVSIELQDGTENNAVCSRFIQYTCPDKIYLTKDFWKIDLTGIPTLQLTDGTKIIFGNGAYNDWRYASEIQKNGNSIKIYYNGGSIPRIDYIEDSVGRIINYNYNATTGRLSSIAYQEGTTTYEVIYTYT